MLHSIYKSMKEGRAVGTFELQTGRGQVVEQVSRGGWRRCAGLVVEARVPT